jgi:hypothetical protein
VPVGLMSVASLRPYSVLFGIIALVAGGGALLAAWQTWRQDRGVSGPSLMLAGIAGLLVLTLIGLAGGRFRL